LNPKRVARERALPFVASALGGFHLAPLAGRGRRRSDSEVSG
jgi:hypothetical protein